MAAVMNAIDPRQLFPDFYSNSAIATLAGAARWTVSGQIGGDETGKRKAPIDVQHLLRGCGPRCQHEGPARGAWARDEQCLVTLEELTDRLPAAANAAFYLQGLTDGLMVIDIEPDCPTEIAEQLLGLRETLYSETSMSGRGYHLVTPLPGNFRDHKDAVGKKVLRHEKGWFEILLEHWCTFTRRPISAGTWARVGAAGEPESQYASTAALYASLAASTRVAQAASTEVRTAAEAPEIPGGQEIVTRTLDGAAPRFKTPDDFDHDTSRWEFSTLGVLHREMRRHLVIVGFLKRTRYSDSDVAWLLYEAAREVLPPRPKHREKRNGRPFLLDRAAAMVAANKEK